MKKQMLIGGIAAIAAVSSLVVLGTSSSVDAANVATTSSTQSTLGKAIGGFGGKMGREGKGMKEKIFNFAQGEFGGGPGFHGNEAIQTAIKNNDYNAFVTAWNADDHHPSDATVPTQEEFTKMVTRNQKETAINAAIDANDYNAFVSATKPTQEEFNDIVARRAEQKAVQSAIENNDYAAFQTATASHPNAGKITQEQFTKMVERFKQKTSTTTQQ